MGILSAYEGLSTILDIRDSVVKKILLIFWDLCTSQFILDFLALSMQNYSIRSSLMKYAAFPSLERALQVFFQWETVSSTSFH